MLKELGRLIWKQSRDISVYNYPKHILYEIPTNQGFLRIRHCKETNRLIQVDGLAYGCETLTVSSVGEDKNSEKLFPALK